MAQWSGNKVNPNDINNGIEYRQIDRPTRQQLNAIVNNSLFASNIAENVASQLAGLGANDKVEFKGSNPNLLINGNFVINQRRQQTYTEGASVDGYTQTNVTTTVNSDHTITLTGFKNYGRLVQKLKNFETLKGKTVTLSVKFKNVSYTKNSDPRLLVTDGVNNSMVVIPNGFSGIATLTKTLAQNTTTLEVRPIHNHLNTTDSDLSVTIEWAKLEVGSIATAFSPKPYEEELADCQVIEGGLATTYSNPNLLINGNLEINQRGKPIYSRTAGAVYTVDHWFLWSQNCSFNADEKTLINDSTTGNAIFSQYIENSKDLNGETLTLSAKYNGVIYRGTGIVPSQAPTNDYTISLTEIKENDVTVGYIRILYKASNSLIRIDVGCAIGKSVKIDYVKLELGSIATPFVPRPYAEELAMCQRYFVKVNTDAVFTARGNSESILTVSVVLPITLRNTSSFDNIAGKSISIYTSTGIISANVSSVQSYSAQGTNIVSATLVTNASSLGYGILYGVKIPDFNVDAEL